MSTQRKPDANEEARLAQLERERSELRQRLARVEVAAANARAEVIRSRSEQEPSAAEPRVEARSVSEGPAAPPLTAAAPATPPAAAPATPPAAAPATPSADAPATPSADAPATPPAAPPPPAAPKPRAKPPAPAPAISISAAAPPADATTDGEPDEDAEASGGLAAAFRGAFRNAPPWLVSVVVHAVGLVILALMTFVISQDKPQGVVIAASDQIDEASQLEELLDVELQPMEEPELQDVSVPVTEPDPGQISFANVASMADMDATSEVGDMALPETTIGEIGALFGTEGKGMSDVGAGLKAAATFFGTKSSGNRFVFVVDNSNSMGRGKFETTLMELVSSVEKMGPRQQFYVIFFSDMPYGMFHPNPVERPVAATAENKAKLKRWLYTVEMCLRTQGEEAMQKAIAMRPDVIFILGDGAFTDKTAPMLTAPHKRRIVINTVGMQVNQTGEQQLTAIAKANGGTYRLVGSTPAAVAMARANPIKRNNTRGPVWGLKLPAQPKQK